jgi:small GTP-binding protein
MDIQKIIILGVSGSGKTTTLKHICKDMVKTTAMDYGKTIVNGKKIHFFSPSGQVRFKFMQEVLCKNIDGAIILIDSTKGINDADEEILNFIENKGVPYVIFANKNDLKRVVEMDKIPVIPTTAITGQGITNGLNILLKLIEQNNDYEKNKIACAC